MVHPPESSDQPLTLQELQRIIRDRYYATDKARGPQGTFVLFIEEVGELATALHTCAGSEPADAAARANLEEEFADVLAWLATLANVMGVDLDQALRAKYTGPGAVEGVKP